MSGSRRKRGRRLTAIGPFSTDGSPGNSGPDTYNESTSLMLMKEINATVGGTVYLFTPNNLTKRYDLGSGYFASVEAHYHEPSRQIVAVKKIRHDTYGTNRHPEDFYREHMISVNSANCDYLIKSYGVLFHESEIWIVMEKMDSSLDKLYVLVYEAGAIFPEQILLYLAYCTISALEYLRKFVHVIHRDVKPSNILVNRLGDVKVCDFGIAGLLTNSVAQTNVGTERYLAPERIAAENKNFSIKADVWSFGLSLLELATGGFPYGNCDSVFERIKMLTEMPPPQLPAESPYSKHVRLIIERCLVLSHTDRSDYLELLRIPAVEEVNANKSHLKLCTATFFSSYITITTT